MNRIILFVFLMYGTVHAQEQHDASDDKALLCFNHEFGVKYYTTLQPFNAQLGVESVEPINLIGFNMSGGIGMKTAYTFHFLEIGASSSGNGAGNNEFQISLTDFDFGINSTVILRRLSPFALEPGIKVGLGMARVLAISKDTTLTMNDFYNGVNTMFYEQSRQQFYIQPGLLVGHSIGRRHPPILYLHVSYKIGVTDYGWNIPDFPVNKLDGLLVRVGLRYLIRR